MNFELKQLIFRKQNVFTNEECNFLIEEYDKLEENWVYEECPEATTNVNTLSTYKRVILEPTTEAGDLVFKKTEYMINEYLDYLDGFDMFHTALRDRLVYSHMLRLLKYETGTKIHPHTDHDPYVYGSCTFNLNDDYTGGEFSFWKGKYDLKLNKGEGIIWPADYFWVHQVKEVTSGVRYSTNSFILSIPSSFRQSCYDFLDKIWDEEEDGKGRYAKEVALRYNIRKKK
jgi:hypothetical protein